MPRAPKPPSSKSRASKDRPEPRAANGRARSATRKAPSSEGPHAGIEVGAQVRVVEGAFAGKVGVVEAFDVKGAARVKLGLLSVSFELKHLAPHAERRARPVLGTSHRKPLPARS